MNVAIKMSTLIQNCHPFSFGVEKFSLFMSSSVAASSSPTTAGRNPKKMLCTMLDFMYFMRILHIIIIRISDGKISANVAVALPSIAIVSLMPALCTAV